MKKYVFIFLMLLIPNFVHAATYTYVADVPNITMQLVETDYASSPIENPYNASYAFGQVLQIDYIISNYSFLADTNYQLETHLPNQVLTNADTYTVIGLNGESCLISYQSPNTIMNNEHYPRWAFQCPHATQTITISIRNSSNQYLWGGTDIFKWTSAVLSSSTTSLSGSGTSTDNIINNQNQNTQSIINNQNQNTQDIINNQNQNTQDIIDSNKVCNYKDYDKNDIKTSNVYLNSSGVESSTTGWGISDYIMFKGDITILNNSTNVAASICFYTDSKSLISCQTYKNVYDNGLNVPSNAKYLRFSIQTSNNVPRLRILTCENGSTAITNSLNDLNDSIKDDDIDTSLATDFFDNFSDNNHGLTGIVSAPLTAINAMLSNQCTDLSATWKGQTITLPCGTSFWQKLTGFQSFLNVALDGLICYRILIKLFKLIEKLKNPDDDRVEVMDL